MFMCVQVCVHDINAHIFTNEHVEVFFVFTLNCNYLELMPLL